MVEQWRDVPGSNGRYQVSSHGNVMSLRARKGGRIDRKILRPAADKYGYLRVKLYLHGLPKQCRVHRLVLLAFVGEPAAHQVACHQDDNPNNNRLENLRWDSPSSNSLDVVKSGRHVSSRKLACPLGHAYSGQNLYQAPNGDRVCRSCKYGHYRNYRYGDDAEAKSHQYYKENIVGSSD